MNTSQSSARIKAPWRLWRRFQYWRAMRIYARLARWARKSPALKLKADRLIGKNVEPPMPLWQHADRQGWSSSTATKDDRGESA